MDPDKRDHIWETFIAIGIALLGYAFWRWAMTPAF